MRRLLFFPFVLFAISPAGALELPAYGGWLCGVGDGDMGALEIRGGSYTFTDLADVRHEGLLSSEDGQAYTIESGILRDIHRVISFNYDGADAIRLVLVYADGSTGFGNCRRS